MSRYKTREFQLGDYWLSKIKSSPSYYRTWLDKKTRQTRRTSLRTTDFAEAKQILTEWFINNQRPQQAEPEDVSIASVLSSYYEHHGKNLASSNQVLIASRQWLDFFGEAGVNVLFSIREQEKFHEYLRARGQVNTTINRNLSVGQSAINRAWKRGELKSVPHIQMLEKGAAEPRGRPMEISELRRLLACAPNQRLVDFIYWMLGTAARPSAIMELKWQQVDFDNKIIRLNPAGRKQNKKHRPTVKMPQTIKDRYWLNGNQSRSGPIISYAGNEIKSVRTSWRKARDKAGLDKDVNLYSLRHTAARWMRKEGVPAWDVAAQLGHKSREFSMTERYAPYSPDHMEKSVAALNRLLKGLEG